MKAKQPSIITAIFTFSCLLSTQTFASSPDSWDSYYKTITAKCLQASNLKNSKPAGKIVSYGDLVGFDALLIRGTYPQKHMKNQTGVELCLYDRKNSKAYVTDADNINKP